MEASCASIFLELLNRLGGPLKGELRGRALLIVGAAGGR
jgi:hypothetical protein